MPVPVFYELIFEFFLCVQASQVQLWVVRQQGKGLTPYNVRATRTPPTAMPGEAVERQLEL